MHEGYINAFHHRSPHAGEFSFNAGCVYVTRWDADIHAQEEERIEPFTRRIGVWRVRSKN